MRQFCKEIKSMSVESTVYSALALLAMRSLITLGGVLVMPVLHMGIWGFRVEFISERGGAYVSTCRTLLH